MQMLEKGQENDVEVTWQDQSRINTFGKLNSRASELKDQQKIKLKDKQALEDASNELLLADEDDVDAVMYLVGENFVRMDKESIESRLTNMSAVLDKEIDGLRAQIEEIQSEMASLKAALYAKFKDAINLESDE